MYCTNCGHENRAGARFCSACGAPLVSRARIPTNQAPAYGLGARVKDTFDKADARLKANVFLLAAFTLSLAVIMTFAHRLVTSLELALTRFASLAVLEAGLGTAVFFACSLAPLSLSLLVILALASALQKTSDHVIRAAYFPLVAVSLVCLVIVVGFFVFQDPGANDMAIALKTTFDSFLTSAAVGLLACPLAIWTIRLSNARTERAN